MWKYLAYPVLLALSGVAVAAGAPATVAPASSPVPAAQTPPKPLAPTADEGEAGVLAARFLTRFHYRRLPLDDAMSQKIFKRYLEALDSDKLFFTQADIDGFGKYKDTLDDAIKNEDLAAPFAMFNLYERRIGERVAYARSLLAKGFDFNRDESYRFDRDKAPWAKDTAELDDLWRKRVKNDWLRLKLAGKPDAEIRDTLEKRYQNYLDRVYQLNSEDVFQTFMNAYAMSIGPHTNYLGPRASENFDIAMKLSLEGIGAVLQRQDDYTAIREIVPGGPAALSNKLRVGDRIVGVGQGTSGPITDVIGWRLDDVVEKIRGPKDTVVRLEILPADAGPDGKHVVIDLTRKKVSIEEQAAKDSVIDVDGDGAKRRIGVISLPTFYQDFEARRRGDPNYKSATRDVMRLVRTLEQGKVDGIIIDLRNNGGGSLSEATDLTGLFIDKGPVVQVRNATGSVQEEDDPHPGLIYSGPLAVLVNRASASASEIFAGAIQDYGRGLIIGENTFGKGTVQNLIDLDEIAHNEKPIFGEVKMTIAQFFRVDGSSTQLRGVVPDIAFPLSIDVKHFGESSYDNALPWSSIAPANYVPSADLKPLVPMLKSRHDKRVATDIAWQNLEADIADARAQNAVETVSLNEAVRRHERDEREAKQAAREQREKQADATAGHTAGGLTDTLETAPATPDDLADGAAATTPGTLPDDGLQPDERSIASDLKREQARKAQRDVVLDETANIVADMAGILAADPKLAATSLPHAKVEFPAEPD